MLFTKVGTVRSTRFYKNILELPIKTKNVRFFKELKNESFGKHAIIEDPDGHLISIAEMKSKAADEFDLLGLLGAE